MKRLKPMNLKEEFYDLNTWIWALGNVLKNGYLLSMESFSGAKGFNSRSQDAEVIGLAFYPFIDSVEVCPPVLTDHDGIVIIPESKGNAKVILLADRDFPEGSRVCTSHGGQKNIDYLYTIGDVFLNNPNDYLEMSLDATDMD
jgi:hypothetical protein